MAFDAESIALFIGFVLPGFVSISVYRLIMPSRGWDWSSGLLQGLFYSSLNFVVLLPLIFYVASAAATQNQLVRAWLGAVASLLVFPALWPVLLRTVFKSERLARKIQIPYPSAWDYFFDSRKPVFILVHLKNGELVGGHWGARSYAGSFPNDGDIYLEAVYNVDKKGHFGEPIPDTWGILLTRDVYAYLEMFDVPEEA